MEIIHARCCAIDAHQASLAVCVSIMREGKYEEHRLRCRTSASISRGQAALARNRGYHRRNTSSSSLLRTFVRVCSNRWAPRSVHCTAASSQSVCSPPD